jgi:hypothetical protein
MYLLPVKRGSRIPRPDYLREQPTPSFCVGCSEPLPWATRQERVERLYSRIDFEDDLTDSDRLRLVEDIAVLAQPDEPDGPTDEERVRAESGSRGSLRSSGSSGHRS